MSVIASREIHTYAVSQSHSENAPSLRITRPFPALLDWARSLDLQNMDPTDHGHIPFVVILVRAMDEWRNNVRALTYVGDHTPAINKLI